MKRFSCCTGVFQELNILKSLSLLTRTRTVSSIVKLSIKVNFILKKEFSGINLKIHPPSCNLQCSDKWKVERSAGSGKLRFGNAFPPHLLLSDRCRSGSRGLHSFPGPTVSPSASHGVRCYFTARFLILGIGSSTSNSQYLWWLQTKHVTKVVAVCQRSLSNYSTGSKWRGPFDYPYSSKKEVMLWRWRSPRVSCL